MAGSSFFALLDDIATLLDDISVMSKVAAKKTAGVLGDDLALNAEQVTGVKADRELPVVFAVFKGSLINKAILVPAAMVISYFLPWAITPLLMLGGLFLCFEGCEKIFHKLLHSTEEIKKHHQDHRETLKQPKPALLDHESRKIKGAIRTDFILSAEIIVITLGTVVDAPFLVQIATVAAIAVLMTIGVYGLVGFIVKIDDMGLALVRPKRPSYQQALGRSLLALAPKLMKTLSVAGTIAMFLVGGGILTHGIPSLHHSLEGIQESFISSGGQILGDWLLMPLAQALIGLIAGAVVLGTLELGKRLIKRARTS